MPLLDALTVYNSFLERRGNKRLKRAARSVYKVQHVLRQMEISDPDLREICQHILVQRSHDHPRLKAAMRHIRTVDRIRSDLEPTTLFDLAVGVEVFRRAPANLDAHAELRGGQVQAAAGLLQNLIIKMDTGEGKTYALLPAAFALAAQYPNVYIVCANDYLAERDALR